MCTVPISLPGDVMKLTTFFAAILVMLTTTLSYAQGMPGVGDPESSATDFLYAADALEDASDAGYAVFDGSLSNVHVFYGLLTRAVNGFFVDLPMSGNLELKIDQCAGTATAGLAFWSSGWGAMELGYESIELAAEHMEWEEWEESSLDSWDAEMDGWFALGEHGAADSELTILNMWNVELEATLSSEGF